MSRSGYTDDNDDPLALGRWRQAVRRSIEGKRGQALLQDLADALDAMPDKRLYPNSFSTADGEFCTLGALGTKRGTKMDDLGDAEDGCDTAIVGQRFDIAPAMAAEIMYLNDEHLVECWPLRTVEICGPMRPHYPDWGEHKKRRPIYNENHPQERWKRMREWVSKNLKQIEVQREIQP